MMLMADDGTDMSNEFKSSRLAGRHLAGRQESSQRDSKRDRLSMHGTVHEITFAKIR